MGDSLMQLRRGILLNTPHIATASGDIITFQTDMTAPLKSLSVDAEATTVTRTGKNLLGGEALVDSILLTIPTATVDRTSGTITYAGNQPDNNSRIISTGMKFKENTRYTFLYSYTGERRNFRWFYTDGTYDGSSSVPTSGVYVSAAGKTVASLRKIRYNNNPVTLNYNNCGIFEGRLSATDFEAYVGEYFQPNGTIKTLVGQNNIWADTGTSEVKYWTHI